MDMKGLLGHGGESDDEPILTMTTQLRDVVFYGRRSVSNDMSFDVEYGTVLLSILQKLLDRDDVDCIGLCCIRLRWRP